MKQFGRGILFALVIEAMAYITIFGEKPPSETPLWFGLAAFVGVFVLGMSSVWLVKASLDEAALK